MGESAVSGDSSDAPDASGFVFSVVQPYVQAVKQAIGWEETDTESKKSKTYFPFLKRTDFLLPTHG